MTAATETKAISSLVVVFDGNLDAEHAQLTYLVEYLNLKLRSIRNLNLNRVLFVTLHDQQDILKQVDLKKNIEKIREDLNLNT